MEKFSSPPAIVDGNDIFLIVSNRIDWDEIEVCDGVEFEDEEEYLDSEEYAEAHADDESDLHLTLVASYYW
jgi:hypothetical protein